MKRVWRKTALFTAALVLSTSLAACSGGGSTTPAQKTATPAKTAEATAAPASGGKMTNDGNYIFATGGTSGTYYPLGGAMATIVNKNVTGANMTIQATGASKENVMLTSKGEADFAIIQNDVLDYAANGTDLFKNDGKIEGLATVASLYPEVVQVVVAEDSGINTIADLKGRKVSLGDSGSGAAVNALQALQAFGMSDKDLQVNWLSFKESGNAFKDGAIEAFFVTAGVPNAAITELAVTRKLKLLDISGAEADKLIAEHPFYTKITIPKDVYKTSSDINTIAVRALIVCRKDLTTEEVYNVTKALYEHLDELGTAHAKGKEIKLEDAKMGVTVPLHPGAEQYFAEKGLK